MEIKFPKALDIYKPTFDGDGEPVYRHIVYSQTEYDSIVKRYDNSGSLIKESPILWNELKGNFLIKIYNVTPNWIKIVLGYVILRILEEVLKIVI